MLASQCCREQGLRLSIFGSVQLLLHGKDGFLCSFKHYIKAADDCHRQNNVTVFAADIDVAQAVVCDSPYKTDYRVVP